MKRGISRCCRGTEYRPPRRATCWLPSAGLLSRSKTLWTLWKTSSSPLRIPAAKSKDTTWTLHCKEWQVHTIVSELASYNFVRAVAFTWIWGTLGSVCDLCWRLILVSIIVSWWASFLLDRSSSLSFLASSRSSAQFILVLELELLGSVGRPAAARRARQADGHFFDWRSNYRGCAELQYCTYPP